MKPSPIGIFDSGFGGLSVYKEIKALLPQYSYIYLGDTARAPYGCLSFDEIYENTLQAIKFLFDRGCHLVILACNTASAQALRTIQQTFLLQNYPNRRVLGVIRPCTEQVINWSKTGHVGLLATSATVASNSYGIEIAKFAPRVTLSQQACLEWVKLVEAGEAFSAKSAEVVQRDVNKLLKNDPSIDTIILACTHFSHLESAIEEALRLVQVKVIHQGPIVARALQRYLCAHPILEKRCMRGQSETVYTTGRADEFILRGQRFMSFSGKVDEITLR